MVRPRVDDYRVMRLKRKAASLDAKVSVQNRPQAEQPPRKKARPSTDAGPFGTAFGVHDLPEGLQLGNFLQALLVKHVWAGALLTKMTTPNNCDFAGPDRSSLSGARQARRLT